MLVSQCHKPSPSHHHFYGWDSNHQKLGWFMTLLYPHYHMKNSNEISGWMVGSFNPFEKYESIGMIIPNRWENKKCSKPPNRNCYGSQGISQLRSINHSVGYPKSSSRSWMTGWPWHPVLKQPWWPKGCLIFRKTWDEYCHSHQWLAIILGTWFDDCQW